MRRLLLLTPLLILSCEEAAPSPTPASGAAEEKKNGDPAPTAPEGPAEVRFDQLSTYDFKPGVAIPPEVQGLHDRVIRITGFIYPGRQTRNMQEFILMKDRGTCCYGPKTQWTHFLQVKVPPGGTPVNYSTDPITVVGTFRVDPQADGDFIMGLYYLDLKEHSQ